MQYHYIAIEGNIGAGKTTLAHLLSKKMNARLILEQFADNPFLPKFYENPKLYAFPLELFFMAERYKQLKEMINTNDLFQSITISDYVFSKCLLFAKVNLPEEEFRLYQKLFDIMQQQLVFRAASDSVFFRAAQCAARLSRFLANESIRSRSTSEESAREYPFSLRLEDNTAPFVGGRCVRHFSLLRDMGANLRHEKRRRNAGAKHRLRCRW
jgi:thymidylate kinase